MKIRTGFVANSSSSSFIIAGVCFKNKEEVVEEFKKHNYKVEDLLYSEDYNDIETCEMIEILAKKQDMDYVCDSDNDIYYLGYDLDCTNLVNVIEQANKAKEKFGINCKIHSGVIN